MDTINRERWHLYHVDDAEVHAVSSRLQIKAVLAKILLMRNIGDRDESKLREFVNPPKALIRDTSRMCSPENKQAALDRLRAAIVADEPIMVNGDPDADGITAGTIMVSSLRRLGATVYYDYPTRATEGHGLQPRIIDEAVSKECSLIVTVDCGSNDIQAAEYAKEHNVDVIVCDHHILSKRRPDVVAMVNPNTNDERTPFHVLSGAGMAFKLMVALYDFLDETLPDDFESYLLALVTLGTISDRMSFLEPMNRALILAGLDGINRSKMQGIRALRDISSSGYQGLKPRDISRTIVPRLNAPGRIGNRDEGIPDSRLVVDLLLLGLGKKNRKKADRLATQFQDVFEVEEDIKRSKHGLQEAAMVDDVNEQRKYVTNKIEDEIDDLIDAQVNPDTDKIVVVRGKNWNPGVIGIDTDRLKDRFLRPAMILTDYSTSDYVRGSARSIPGIHLYNVVAKVGERFFDKTGKPLYQSEVMSEDGPRMINAFGGHSQACGFTLHKDNVDQFKALLREEMATLSEESFNFCYEIADTLEFKQVTPKLVDCLDQLSPYGQEFDYPIFYMRHCKLRRGRAFGNKYQVARTPHIDFEVIDGTYDGDGQPPRLKAVGFGLCEKFHDLTANLDEKGLFDLIFVVERHKRVSRNGKVREEFRLNVQDIRLSNEENLELLK